MYKSPAVTLVARYCIYLCYYGDLFIELLSTFLDDNTEKFTKALYEKVQEIKVSKETSGLSSGKKRSAKVIMMLGLHY